jgi:flagellar secretion chaperone FliS
VATGYQAYQTNAIHTAPPEQLVVMLYDGCLRFLRRAEAAAEAGDRPRLTDGVSRATAIIMELNATLDMERGGEIAGNLRSLYFFLHRHLIDASREGSGAKVRQAITLVADLREAFAEAAKKAA